MIRHRPTGGAESGYLTSDSRSARRHGVYAQYSTLFPIPASHPDTANGDLLAPYQRLTCRVEQAVADLCRELPVKQVAAHFGLEWHTVRAIDQRRLELGTIRDRINAVLDGEPGLRHVGISELSNRVEVGADPDAVTRIVANLEAAGVPKAAFRVQQQPAAFDDS